VRLQPLVGLLEELGGERKRKKGSQITDRSLLHRFASSNVSHIRATFSSTNRPCPLRSRPRESIIVNVAATGRKAAALDLNHRLDRRETGK